jgi:hypothetical protein
MKGIQKESDKMCPVYLALTETYKEVVVEFLLSFSSEYFLIFLVDFLIDSLVYTDVLFLNSGVNLFKVQFTHVWNYHSEIP